MSLLFGESYFVVDKLDNKEFYFIRQAELIDDYIRVQMDYTPKETLEYQIANFNAIGVTSGDGHVYFGFNNKTDAQNAANWMEGLVLAAILKSKS